VALEISQDDILETEIRKALPDHALVMLAGELDTSNVSRIYEVFAELTGTGVRHIALNLAELEFVDSTGLSAIIALHKRTQQLGGELIIFSPKPAVRNLFVVTGINEYLDIRPLKP
jgi:anti-sigma B factor antagonist